MTLRVKKFYKSELTVSGDTPNRKKNYLSVLISIFVLILISSMIVASIVIVNPEIVNFLTKPYTPREAVTLEDSLLGELYPNDFSSQWLSPIQRRKTQLPEPENASNREQQQLEKQALVDELLFEDSKNLKLVQLSPQETTTTDNTNANNFSSLLAGEDNIQVPLQRKSFNPNITTLISNSSLLASIEFQGFKISPSKRYLLVWTNKVKQFRHSFTAKFFIYDIKLDLISLLSTKQSAPSGFSLNQSEQATSNPDELETGSSPAKRASLQNSFEHLDSATEYLNDQDQGDEQTRFQHVEWFSCAPMEKQNQSQQDDEENNDSLILIQNNDLYLLEKVGINQKSQIIMDNPMRSSSSSATPKRLTDTGKVNEIFNGIPDWLYEEEILADTPAYQVSPAGTTLAYMSFNDSLVDLVPFSIYGPYNQIIPKTQRIRYSKAGRPNPIVKVYVIDLTSSYVLQSSNQAAANFFNSIYKSIELKLPEDLENKQHYIFRIKWLTNDKLLLSWLNRDQNESYFLICSRNQEWKCEKNLHQKAKGGWLDMSDDFVPLDENFYLALLLKDEGDDVGKFKHLAKISTTTTTITSNNSESFTFLTNGKRELVGIDGVDKIKKLVYYTSTVENEPGQRQAYFVNYEQQPANSKSAPEPSTCLTCDFYPQECLYNSIKLSPSASHYVFECHGPGVPRYELRRLPTTEAADSANKLNRQEKAAAPFSSVVPNFATTSTKPTEQSDQLNSGDSKSLPSLRQRSSPTTNNQNQLHEQQQQKRRKQILNEDEEDSTLLWTIEDNQMLRDKINNVKAMPLTMRLKVPIANTNYSANVLMLLPPQLGYTTTYKASTSSLPISAMPIVGPFGAAPLNSQQQQQQQASGRRLRLTRGLKPIVNGLPAINNNHGGIQQQAHQYFTPESFAQFSSQINSGGQQYPMIVDVYGGPGSQKVDYRFAINFGHYMASSRRTVYVMIDGRGSGFQGTKRLYELYRKFGTVEIQDQIDVAAYLARNYSFIDPNKVAIWGWSYGGYAAAMALARSNGFYNNNLFLKQQSPMPTTTTSGVTKTTSKSNMPPLLMNTKQTKGGGIFECAVSVAPVTNWIYYDTAYTERYMSSPYLNEQYDNYQPGDHLNTSMLEQQFASLDLLTKLSIYVSGGLVGPSSQSYYSSQANLDAATSGAAANNWLSLNRTLSMKQDESSSSSSIVDKFIHNKQQPLNSRDLNKMASVIKSLDLNQIYKSASLIENISAIDKKRFLLIHGTADDNVHFQQSIMLMKQLISKNILFESRLYPDQDHSIGNKADKLHLGSTLSNFFAECFDMPY